MKETSPIFSFLAICGALAWLPHIGRWVYALLIKPKLRFVPDTKAEVGYSNLGPVVNQNFAIVTELKDALIERILLTLTHEDGDQHKFIWKKSKGNEI